MKAIIQNRYLDGEVTLTADQFSFINPETHGDPKVLLERMNADLGEKVIFLNTEALLSVYFQE